MKLQLSYWTKPATDVLLDDIETAVITDWQPPLNLQKVLRPLQQLMAARKVMADHARAWAKQRGVDI